MKKFVGMVFGVMAACLLAGCAQKSIFLVTSYADGSPRVAEIRNAIRAEMAREQVPYHFNVFNMNLQAHPTPTWREETGHVAVVRADAYKADVVLVAGEDAARYFAKRLIGKPKQVVFFDLVGNPSDYNLSPTNKATGIIEDVPVQESFALMKQLVPNARGVGVLADRSIEGDALVGRIQAASSTLPIRVVDVKRASTREEWMAAVRDLQTKADVLCIASYSSVLPVADTANAIPPMDLLKATSEINRLPDFSFRKEAVGPAGVMAAVVVPVEMQAKLATRQAIDTLFYNQKIQNTPVIICDARATFINAQRAAALGVKIPENLEIPAAAEAPKAATTQPAPAAGKAAPAPK